RDSQQTLSEAILGTPSYMAPEQASGHAKDAGVTADVYSLGAILYELLTGNPPFRGETKWETLQQVISQDPILPSHRRPKVPRDLETICLKCLQKEPGRRYGSALHLAEDLQRFRTGQAILARPVSLRERITKWVKRRPAVAALSAMLVLVLVSGLA